MENYKQYLLLAVLGAAGYSLIEILWRGYTHWTMAVAGGIGFLMLCILETRVCNRPLVQQALLGGGIITALELAAGIVINLMFGLSVWDYSREPGNFLGQICIYYSVLWFLLCLFVFPLIRSLRRFTKLHDKNSSKNRTTDTRMREI